MFKKLMLIGVLCFSLTALLQTQAIAWNITGGGWGWGSYQAKFYVKGGTNPDDLLSVELDSQVYVVEAALVCVNPGNYSQDVRVGLGGITFIGSTPGQDWEPQWIGPRYKGTFNVTQNFNSSILEFGNELYDGGNGIEGCNPKQNIGVFIEACSEAVENFKDFFGVDESYCRNSNWTPYQYLIKKLTLTGTVYDEGMPTNANITLSCETNESYRRWAEDNEVIYVCKEVE